MLLIVSFIVFSLIQLAPYDAIDSITTPNMSSETVELLRQKHGLDQPFLVQYMMWLKEILQGNFGYSLVSQQSIGQELLIRIPNTIKLILPAYLTALILSIALGLVAGANKGKFVDKLIDGICSVGISMPTFWFAMLLIYLLGYKLDLLPIIGMHTVGQEDSFVDFLQHFIMPYLVLVVAFFPDLTRYVRSSTLLQLSEDYVMVQKSFGATKREIFFKHVSKNVLLPIVTQLGLALPMLVTGAIITESIFGWPGIGPYLMSATKALDFPVIMAVMLLSATLVILGNLLSDVLYTVVDPRISQGDK
jgi:peptide/nickel transport system permease protein